MTALEALTQAQRCGLRLRPRGGGLAVSPVSRCPPALLAALREHKEELLDYLDAQAANLSSDCRPWLHTAKQILAGEFHGADKSTKQSLTIGLAGIRHQTCQKALERLNDPKAG